MSGARMRLVKTYMHVHASGITHETEDSNPKLISRNVHTNSARSINMTGHFHALGYSLTLVETLVVNWGSVKELDQSLHRERIHHRCL
jgi:hypothetical protein